MPVLSAIDILGVQRYVFASSRLRDVIAASWLVHWATASDGALNKYQNHVLFAAGANALLEFETIIEAQRFAGGYSRLLLENAPGLEVVVIHHKFALGGLAAALSAVQVKLARAKLQRISSAEQMGLSVTARCQITGLPACGFDPQEQNPMPLARMALRWTDSDVHKAAKNRWRRFLPTGTAEAWDFPLNIDQMGRTYGDTSLLGVIHLDGNGIGEKIQKWQQICIEQKFTDDAVKMQYREWSGALDSALEHTFQAMVQRVYSAIREGKVQGLIPEMSFGLYTQNGINYLPLRPILLGGDDLTVLCDGRISLDLAASALSVLEKKEIPHLGRLNGCAGIALVRTHYPFARAYQMAEGLCASSKAKRRIQSDNGSWIDWHVGAMRPSESIEVVRKRAYTLYIDCRLPMMLTCRPYRHGIDKNEVESWRWLSETVLGVDGYGFHSSSWRESRNKIKVLRTVAREGPEAVAHALRAWQVANPNLILPEGLDEGGYLHQSRTPLLDALELLDIHLPLEPVGQEVCTCEQTF